jgi:hypothetical protein
MAADGEGDILNGSTLVAEADVGWQIWRHEPITEQERRDMLVGLEGLVGLWSGSSVWVSALFEQAHRQHVANTLVVAGVELKHARVDLDGPGRLPSIQLNSAKPKMGAR